MAVMVVPALSGGMGMGLVAMSLVGVIALAWSQDVWPAPTAKRLIVTLAVVLVLVGIVARQTTYAWYYDTTVYCQMNGWWDIWTC